MEPEVGELRDEPLVALGRRRRAPPRPPPRRPCARTRLRPSSSSAATYEPSGRSRARSATRAPEPRREARDASPCGTPARSAARAGAARRRRSRRAAPRRRACCPDVSPLCQSRLRERLQNHASPVSRVGASASSSIHASISTRPLSGVLDDRRRAAQAASRSGTPSSRSSSRRSASRCRVLVQDRREQRRLRDLERLGDVARVAGAARGDHRHRDRVGDRAP